MRAETETKTFRVRRSIGVIGVILLFLAVVIFIIPVTVFHSNIAQLFLVALFVIPSIPILLIFLVTKVDIDNEKVNYRNMLGKRRSIFWRDVACVDKLSPQGAVVICSQNTTIRLNSYIEQFKYLKTLVHHYYPNAFNTRQTLTAGMPGIRPANGGAVFTLKRANAIASCVLIFLGIGYVFLFQDAKEVILKYMFISAHLILGLYFLISYLIVRVYIGEEKISYRNTLGMFTEIKWQDIKSARSRHDETREQLIITDGYRTIRGINIGFIGFDLMKKMIKEKYPEAELYKGNKKTEKRKEEDSANSKTGA